MGDAMRQLGEALGALQLPHPLLALPSVGDVLRDADQPGEAPAGGGPGTAVSSTQRYSPSARRRRYSRGVAVPSGHRLTSGLSRGRAVLGVHRLDPAPTHLLVRGPAGEGEPMGVGVVGLPVRTGGPDHEREGVVRGEDVGHGDNLAPRSAKEQGERWRRPRLPGSLGACHSSTPSASGPPAHPALGLALWALWPFITGLMGALVLYVVFARCTAALTRWMRPGAAAGIVVLLGLVLVVGPGISFIGLVANQAQDMASGVLPSPLLARLRELRVGPYDIGAQIEALGSQIVSWVGSSAIGAGRHGHPPRHPAHDRLLRAVLPAGGARRGPGAASARSFRSPRQAPRCSGCASAT